MENGTDDKQFLSHLQVSTPDFLASVHLHPEVIRSLIVAKPKERKEAIDRLLGLSGSRDIVDTLLAAKPAQWTAELDRQIDLINAQLQTALEDKKRTIEKESLELTQKGIPENDLSVQGAIGYATNVLDDIRTFAAEYQLFQPMVTSPSSFTDLPTVRKDLVTSILQLRNQHPTLKDQGVILARRSKLDGLKTSYSAQKQVVTAAENDLRSNPEKRSEAELESVNLSLQQQVHTLEEEMLLVSQNAKLLSDALDFFQNRPETSTASCPLCGVGTKSIPEWRTHIESEIASKNLKPLQEQKASLVQSISALQESRRTITRLKLALADESKTLASQLGPIETALGRKFEPTDDALAILNIELEQLSAKLIFLADQVALINSKLADFDDRLKDLDHFERIGRAQQETEQIEGIVNHPKYQKLKASRAQADQYAEEIELVVEGVSNAVQDEAKKRLTSAQLAISSNFSKITSRPDYPGLKVLANSDGYAIELTNSKGSTKAVPILNHADLNCCALSIFMALAGSPQISHKLGFVILDDPSQSLDEQTRKNLCSALSDLAGARQVIIATADEALASDEQAIPKTKASYVLSDWKPGVGPMVAKSN